VIRQVSFLQKASFLLNKNLSIQSTHLFFFLFLPFASSLGAACCCSSSLGISTEEISSPSSAIRAISVFTGALLPS
jgi:hypothetical protein